MASLSICPRKEISAWILRKSCWRALVAALTRRRSDTFSNYCSNQTHSQDCNDEAVTIAALAAIVPASSLQSPRTAAGSEDSASKNENIFLRPVSLQLSMRYIVYGNMRDISHVSNGKCDVSRRFSRLKGD